MAVGLTSTSEIKSSIIKRVRCFLKANHAELSSRDACAAYLWGSIVRTDFDYSISDIDCVVIYEHSVPEEFTLNLTGKARRDEELASLKLRGLLLSDLNGSPPQSELAKILDPRLLVTDFPSWIWVYGNRLSQFSFLLKPCSLREVYEIRLRSLECRVRRSFSVPASEAPRYVLKEAAYLSHVIHQLSQGDHALCYSELPARSNPVTAEIVHAVVDLRSRCWPEEDCERAMPLVIRFLERLNSPGLAI